MRGLVLLVLATVTQGCGLVLGAEWDGTPAPDHGSDAGAGGSGAGAGSGGGAASGGGPATGTGGDCGDACAGGAVTAVAAGEDFTCAVVAGAAKCWGWNVLGTLGTGSDFETLQESATPVDVVGLSSGVSHIAANVSHACAIVDGTVKCWGWNEKGQLGGASNVDIVPAPVAVDGLTGSATRVAVGWGHSCAIVDGALVCWGNNEFGQIGNGSESFEPVSPTVVIDAGVTDVTAGVMHTCAVVSGSAQCWGQFFTTSTVPEPVEGLRGATAMSASGTMTCAVSDATTWCWGSSEDGALGVPGKTFLLEPTAVPGIPAGASAVDVSDRHACAVASGGAWCWGLYPGDGTSESGFPMSVGSGLDSGVTSIGVGDDHACAIQDGALFCWGSNAKGKLGVPPAETPAQEALEPLRVEF